MSKSYSKSNIKATKLNALSSVLSVIITTIVSFIVSPQFVFHLGSNMFGIWTSIQKYFTFVSVADGRTSQALKWVVAKNEASSSVKDKKRSIGSAATISLILLPLSITVIVAILYLLPSLINDVNDSEIRLIRITGLILAINTILNPILGIPDSILVGTNNGYKSTITQMFWVVCLNLSLLYCVYRGYDISALAIVTVIISLLKFTSLFILAKKTIPWFGVLKPAKEEIKTFLKLSIWVQSWSFVSRLILATEVILFGFLLNSESITYYSFTAKQATISVSIIFLIGNSVLPSLGKLYSSKQYKKAQQVLTKSNEILVFMSLLLSTIILFLNKSFIEIWVGNEYYLGASSNTLIVILMFQLVLIRKNSQVLDACLCVKQKVIFGFISAMLGLVLPILFFNISNHPDSILMGIITGRLLISFYFPSLVKTKYNTIINYKVYLIFLGIIFISHITQPYIVIKSWHSMIIYLTSIVIISAPVLGGLVISKRTWETIKNEIKVGIT